MAPQHQGVQPQARAVIPGQETLCDLALGGVGRGNSKLSCLWHSSFPVLGLLFGYTHLLGLLPALRLQCTQAVNVPNAEASKAHRTHRPSLGGGKKPLKAGQQGKQLLLEALPGQKPCVISMAAA